MYKCKYVYYAVSQSHSLCAYDLFIFFKENAAGPKAAPKQGLTSFSKLGHITRLPQKIHRRATLPIFSPYNESTPVLDTWLPGCAVSLALNSRDSNPSRTADQSLISATGLAHVSDLLSNHQAKVDLPTFSLYSRIYQSCL